MDSEDDFLFRCMIEYEGMRESQSASPVKNATMSLPPVEKEQPTPYHLRKENNNSSRVSHSLGCENRHS